MAYDPQANRRRPKPADTDPAPVDALIGEPDPASPPTPAPESRVESRATTEDPPPAVGVTPAPADPVPDSLVISTGMGAAVGGLITVLTLRWLWKRNRRRRIASAED